MSRRDMPVYPCDVIISRRSCADPGSDLFAAHFLPHNAVSALTGGARCRLAEEIDEYIGQDCQAKMHSDPDRDRFSLITSYCFTLYKELVSPNSYLCISTISVAKLSWIVARLTATTSILSRLCLVAIIATLRWASCGPGTGLQAHPLKSQYRFGKKSLLTNCTKATKNISDKLHLPFLDTLPCMQNAKWIEATIFQWCYDHVFSSKVCIYRKPNNQNGGCYDHGTHEITLAGSHSLHWGRVQWKIPCLKAKRFS